nr:retrovirus-related Pol polyprotein from transposon TNT 1-94 [Tanacetum cinerariifolium]
NMGQDRQMQMVGGNGGNQFRQYAGQNLENLNGYNDVQNVGNQVIQNVVQNPRIQNVGNQNGLIGVPGNANHNPNGNGNLIAARVEGNATGQDGNQIRCYNCRGLGIQLQAEEFDLIAAASDLDEIEEVNANCILMANLQQALTSGTQTDKAPVYDSDGSAEVHNYANCYDNEIFNMFTQEEQYAELLKPIPEPHQVPHNDNNVISENDNNVISEVSSVEQSGGTVEQHPANVRETRVLYDSLYNNLAIEVEKVNTVNRKLKETNAELTTELVRFKNQEKCFKISQEKYDKLERCYQKSVYQEQCLSKKINALHLSSGKQIMTLNEEISDLNKQLSMEKSTISSLLEEKKKLKFDFKIHEDELLDKQIQLEKRIKELDIILVKTAKFIGDCKSLTKEADESLAKHKAFELEIERLLRAVVSHAIMSVVQNNSVDETSNLQTELERTKERFENCIIKKENEYTKLWNDWYKKCEECKFDKISYDKAYNDMQQKIEWLQPQLGDLKGKNTLNPLSHKLENKNVELEFQVLNYAKENAYLKTTYKNLVDSISMTRTQTKTIINSLQNKLHDTIYENAKLSAQLFDKVSDQKDTAYGTSANTKFAKQSILGKPPKVGVDNTKTRRLQPKSNTKNDRVPSASKSSQSKNKEVEVEEHHKKLLLSRNKKHMSSEWQFCDSDLEVAFRRNAYFVRNLKGVDLLSGNHTRNLYTINLHEMASTSPICLMAHASSTKSWLWHQRLSHLYFDTINDLAKNDLVFGLPKFKYHKEHLCPSYEQGKSKRASHPPKPVPNSRQMLHLLHMDLCGPMRIASINGKRVGISHQMSSVRTPQQNRVLEQRNRTLVEAARTMLIFSHAPLFLWAKAIATACFTQNRSIIHRHFNKTPYDLINGRKSDISFLHVFGAPCYPKNDREYIGKLGAKGDIGFFIGCSVDSCTYRVFNRSTKKIMETMNVSFDELSAMAFKQRSLQPGLQSVTSGQISSGTYAPSTITTQQPTEGELDLLFKAMYDDYIGGQPSTASRTVLA